MPARPRNNRTPDGGKRRWTPEDRASRSPRSGASAGGAAAAGRTPGGRADRRAGAGDDRTPKRAAHGIDWYPGGRNGTRPDRSSGDRDDRRGGRPGQDDRANRTDRGARTDRPQRFERDDRPGTNDRPQRGERYDRPQTNDRPQRFERDDRPRTNDRPYRGDRSDRPQTNDRAPRSTRDERPQRGARDDRPQRYDRGESPQRFERGDRPQRGARDDRPQRFDRGESPQRFDRAERPQRGDRDERPQRFDRGESPQRFDRPDRPQRGERDQRPQRFDRDERPQRTERFDRDERPQRTDRRPATQGFSARPERRASGSDEPRRFEQRPSQDRERGASRGRGGAPQRAPHFEAPEDVVLEHLKGEVVSPEDVAGVSFAQLGLGEQITKALADLGATEPFPIQAATIPAALQGRNVLGRGRTGSGKTIAFGAALVERLLRNWAEQGRTGSGRVEGRAPRALVLAPTRELALQIDRTVQPIARAVGLFTTQIVGGVPQARQVGALNRGVDIVIGTPGRMEDLVEQRRLNLGQIEISVLDEADHMAELGFLEPIQRLLRRVPGKGQRLMFSATLDTAVSKLVGEFLPNPDVHEVADPVGEGTADHRVLVIEQGDKLPVLAALVGAADRSLVFARTRAFAEQLADDLEGEGVRTESLHGDLNQVRRTRNLARFSEGKVTALVATDVAARGIHVDGIDLVVHADSAEDYKTYLHRSGRTGRAGASGTIVTLITARRRRRFTELLERAGIDAEFVVLQQGDDPVAALHGSRKGRIGR